MLSGSEHKVLLEKLRAAGLRPTRQRVALANLLFGSGDRHLTAEELHAEATADRIPVSLATIYNTLNQFTAAGLLREVAIEGERTYFDTNTSNHFHFYLEAERRLVDIPADSLALTGLPPTPDGTRISRVDVIVRLEPAKR
jgi:Fur family transcriptional regulator, iron response regulator